jgi:NAD-dependent SIR2 family protein deacetylase
MKCKHDPTLTIGPIGMYHCPECGDMVLAGMAHGDQDEAEKEYGEFCDREMEKMMVWLNERLPKDEFISITQTMKNTLIELWLRAEPVMRQQGCF